MHTRTVNVVLALALTMVAAGVSAQSWEYKSYRKAGPGGSYEKDNFVAGIISLEEKHGQTWSPCKRDTSTGGYKETLMGERG